MHRTDVAITLRIILTLSDGYATSVKYLYLLYIDASVLLENNQ